MTAATIEAELRAAIREVTATFDALPPAVQVRVGPVTRDGVDAEVDAANAAQDPQRALAAVRAWRRHWIATFKEASR